MVMASIAADSPTCRTITYPKGERNGARTYPKPVGTESKQISLLIEAAILQPNTKQTTETAASAKTDHFAEYVTGLVKHLKSSRKY